MPHIIVLGNVSGLSTDDLKEYFADYGTVSDVTLKMDPYTGRSK